MGKFTRRAFLKATAGTCAALGASRILGGIPKLSAATSNVYAVLGDELTELYQMAVDATQAIGIGSGGVNMSGTRVFIKPNLVCMGQGTFRPAFGDTTKAEVMLAVAEQCLIAGADKVTIGDASHAQSWNWSTVRFFPGNTIFGTTNLEAAVNHLQSIYTSQEIELACLHDVDEWELIDSSSTEPLLDLGLKVAKSVCDADHLISISPLKTHQWADISCTMKNLIGTITAQPPYGLLPGPAFMQRIEVHKAYANTTSGGFDQAGIEAAFTDILKWRKDNGKQDFSILECTYGVEANGPRPMPVGTGKTINVKERSNSGQYFVLAGNDMPAVDATAIRIMNQDVETIRTLLMARNMGLGEITDIDLIGTTIDNLRIPDWEMGVPVDEWGLASTLPPAFQGPDSLQSSKMINTLAGLSFPVAMAYGLRTWHQRKQSCGMKHPCKNADIKEESNDE